MEQVIIQAVGNYCLIEKLPTPERTIGSVLVPGSQQSLLARGKVISVGDGKKLERLGLNVDDIIYYNEIENNAVSSDNTPDASYFIREDFIHGKEITNNN